MSVSGWILKYTYGQVPSQRTNITVPRKQRPRSALSLQRRWQKRRVTGHSWEENSKSCGTSFVPGTVVDALFIRLISTIWYMGFCYGHYKTISGGVPVPAQRKRIQLGTMRLPVRSLASLNGLRILHCCGCGVGRQLKLQFNP